MKLNIFQSKKKENSWFEIKNNLDEIDDFILYNEIKNQ
jgi:hypothetical protein